VVPLSDADRVPNQRALNLGAVIIIGREQSLRMMECIYSWLAVVEVGGWYPFGVGFGVFAGGPAFFGEAVIWGHRPQKGDARSWMSVTWVFIQPEA
jgi:hypothetical protein